MANRTSLVALVLLAGCTSTSATPVTIPQALVAQSALVRNERPLARGQFIYWTNDRNGSIGRANIDGSGVNEAFIHSTTGGKIGGGGMAVDKHDIYWTSANGGTATTVLGAKLNGSGVKKDLITGGHNPCGVTADSKYIYWAGDVGSAIGRANRNGTGANPNFIATGAGVCGLVVTSTRIYWANYETNWIGTAKLDGTDVNLQFIQTEAAGSVVLSSDGKYLYWPNNGTGIARANINGTRVNPKFITGLNGEVAFMAVDRTHIYWADWGDRGTGTTIGRANIDGSGVNQSFITGTLGGFGIAVTGGSP
jgi:hypothetical protein